MKKIRNMSQAELAAYVQDSLRETGINVVLSGGSAVSFYSSDKYVSKGFGFDQRQFRQTKQDQGGDGKVGI